MFNLTDLKQEIEDILHPPRAPIPIIGEKSVPVRIEGESRTAHPSNLERVATTDSKPIIDFSYIDWAYLSDNSSFQRGIMEFIKKIVPGLENIMVRGSKEVMAESFSQEKRNYINVMSEFKSKLEKLK